MEKINDDIKKDLIQIGNNIKNIRNKHTIPVYKNNYHAKSKECTQEDIAKLLNVSIKTISRIENGEFSSNDIPRLLTLSKYFNKNIFYFFKGTSFIIENSIKDVFDKYDVLSDEDKKIVNELIKYLYNKSRFNDDNSLAYVNTFSDTDKINLIKNILN